MMIEYSCRIGKSHLRDWNTMSCKKAHIAYGNRVHACFHCLRAQCAD